MYSALTVVIIIGGAVLAGMQVPRIEAGLPTPGLGLFERLNIYAMLMWVAAFSLALFVEEGCAAPAGSPGGSSRFRSHRLPTTGCNQMSTGADHRFTPTLGSGSSRSSIRR